MRLRSLVLVLVLTLLAPFSKAHAWGRRGHSIVCQTAAYLVAGEKQADFLKDHSFDLGYYCNVPDLVWKRPETYKEESFNHFMDMEIFEREFKKSKTEKDPFAMDRLAFNAAYPQIDDKAGRSFWRIRELNDKWADVTAKLKKTGLTTEERQQTQADWLLLAGAVGHYVGDLAQPLHVTENYDGQFSDQKGVHVYFEDDAVNELFHDDNGKDLESEVMATARRKWKAQHAHLAKQSVLELIEELGRASNKGIGRLLELDRKNGRKNIRKAARAFHPMIVDRIAAGAVYEAELMHRQIGGWDFDNHRFYIFLSDPTYIHAPAAPASTVDTTSAPQSASPSANP